MRNYFHKKNNYFVSLFDMKYDDYHSIQYYNMRCSRGRKGFTGCAAHRRAVEG